MAVQRTELTQTTALATPMGTQAHRSCPLTDPTIRELAQRVEVMESDELNELCRLYEQGDPRGRFASTVTIVLRDGREFHSGLVEGGLSFPQPGWAERKMETSSAGWQAMSSMHLAWIEWLRRCGSLTKSPTCES